jgi:hypothetical protein
MFKLKTNHLIACKADINIIYVGTQMFVDVVINSVVSKLYFPM